MAGHDKVVEVFADVGCPFAHVGLERFVERRHQRGRDDVVLWIRAWPLELVNNKPLDRHFIAEEVVDLREQVSSDLFAGFVEEAFPASSMPAFALAAAAYRHDPVVGETVSLVLRHLLFEQGADIGSGEVLDELAAQHGITVEPGDHDAVHTDHAEGLRRGVIGSPHFFTPDGGFFCPALDISRDSSGHLRILADPEQFDRFVESCLEA